MSGLWNSNTVAVGVSLIATVVTPLILITKKRWQKQQDGRGYRDHVILVSRYPTPGTTKTRLIGELGEQGAAKTQRIMSDHMLDQLTSFQEKCPGCWVEVKYNGGSAKEMEYWLGWRCKARRLRMSWSKQGSGHLGQKMAGAFNQAFDKGAERVGMIGSDIPGITPTILTAALGILKQRSEMVLGPAKDGGYYLVGMTTKVHQRLGNDVGSVFEGMDWGTDKVCGQQEQVAKSLGIETDASSLERLQDVDYAEDVMELERTIGVSVKQIKEPVLSIVIPVLNESNNILESLSNIIKTCAYPKYTEIVISDGGSKDDTVNKIQEFAKTNSSIKIKLVESVKGRGQQLNNGVKEACGDHFLFLHADTRLPPRFDQHILITLGVPGVAAGAFQFGLDVLHDASFNESYSWFFKLQMKVLELGTNFRAKYFELPYGDQALFVSRHKFDAVGGFPDFILMEDYELVKRLQKEGHISIVEDEYAITSARRWKKFSDNWIKHTRDNILQSWSSSKYPGQMVLW